MHPSNAIHAFTYIHYYYYELIVLYCIVLHSGQHEVSQFPSLLKFPDAVYYISIAAIIIIHAMIMLARSSMRYNQNDPIQHTYWELHWAVWVTMFVLPILGILLGAVINQLDDYHYRRHLQFLRLEFDTRLGMHSPR